MLGGYKHDKNDTDKPKILHRCDVEFTANEAFKQIYKIYKIIHLKSVLLQQHIYLAVNEFVLTYL